MSRRLRSITAPFVVAPPKGARVRTRLMVDDHDAAALTEAGWRERWEVARLFITADGETGKAWGSETIRFHPGEHWVQVKLPAALSYLANRPHGRYQLSCPVDFPYRGDEVAAQGRLRRHPLRRLPRCGEGPLVSRRVMDLRR